MKTINEYLQGLEPFSQINNMQMNITVATANGVEPLQNHVSQEQYDDEHFVGILLELPIKAKQAALIYYPRETDEIWNDSPSFDIVLSKEQIECVLKTLSIINTPSEISPWVYLNCDHYDTIKQAWCIDAWVSTKTGTAGEIIAHVFADQVNYCDPRAETDSAVQTLIAEVKTRPIPENNLSSKHCDDKASNHQKQERRKKPYDLSRKR